MTTTPALTDLDKLDLDAIRKLAHTAQDWAEYGHPNDPNWDGVRLLIKGVPLLLDELATARRDVEGLTRVAADLIRQISNAGEAVAAWTGRTKDAREQRDGAREELAKTQTRVAILDERVTTWKTRLVEETATLREELAKTRAELQSSNSLIGCLYAAGVDKWEGHAAAVETYARFEAEANPATTAEPAACICATWREETPFGPQTITGPDATCPTHGEKAEPADEPKADVPILGCVHCGRNEPGRSGQQLWAWVGGARLCHPDNPGLRPDCYRLVTVYSHQLHDCPKCKLSDASKALATPAAG